VGKNFNSFFNSQIQVQFVWIDFSLVSITMNVYNYSEWLWMILQQWKLNGWLKHSKDSCALCDTLGIAMHFASMKRIKW